MTYSEDAALYAKDRIRIPSIYDFVFLFEPRVPYFWAAKLFSTEKS